MDTKNQRVAYKWVNISDDIVYEWARLFKGQVYEWGRFQNTDSNTRITITRKLPRYPSPQLSPEVLNVLSELLYTPGKV